MSSRSTAAHAAQQVGNQSKANNMVSPRDSTGADRQYAVHHEEDARIMAMLDDHLDFIQQSHNAPWTPESDSAVTTSDFGGDGSHTPVRPTSSGSNTMFVDWDEYGAPIVTYRHGAPPPRPQPQRQGSAATMFVDLDHNGGVQVSYRNPSPNLPSPVDDLTASREDFMGLGIGTEAWVHAQSQVRYVNLTPPPLTYQPSASARNLPPFPPQPRPRRTVASNHPRNSIYEIEGRQSSYQRPAPLPQIQLRRPGGRNSDALAYQPYQPPTRYDYPSHAHQALPAVPPQIHIRQPNAQSRKRDIPPYGGYQAYQPAPLRQTPHSRPPRHTPHSKPLPRLPKPTPYKQAHKRGTFHVLIHMLLGLFSSDSSGGKGKAKAQANGTEARKGGASAYQRGVRYP